MNAVERWGGALGGWGIPEEILARAPESPWIYPIELFRLTCEVARRTELADDPAFATNEARVRNRADLIPVLQEIFRTKPAAWWLEALEDAGYRVLRSGGWTRSSPRPRASP